MVGGATPSGVVPGQTMKQSADPTASGGTADTRAATAASDSKQRRGNDLWVYIIAELSNLNQAIYFTISA